MPMTVTHAKSNTIADFTGTATVFNSSGGTGTVLATNLVRPTDWNSAHQATLSVDKSEVFSMNFWEPFVGANTNSSLSAPGVGTWYLDPINVPWALGSGQLNFMAADAAGFLNGTTISAASSGSNTLLQTMNTQIVLYSHGTGAESTRLESTWSTEISRLFTWQRRVGTTATSAFTMSNFLTVSFPSQFDASGGCTYGSTSQSGTISVGASTGASTVANNLITGAVAYASGSKLMQVPFATRLPAGEYYLGMMISSSSSSQGTNYTIGTMCQAQSVLGMLEFVNQAYKRHGESISNSSTCILPFHGSVASTTTSPVSPLRTSDMRNFATNHRRYFNHQRSTY
jgi:hypothetical protein